MCCGWCMHFDMGEVTAEAKEVVRDFLGHWNGLWGTQNTLSSTFESLFSGCFVENGLRGGRRLEAAKNIRSLGQPRCVTDVCWVGQHLHLPTTPQRGPFYSPRHPRELSEFLMDRGLCR